MDSLTALPEQVLGVFDGDGQVGTAEVAKDGKIYADSGSVEVGKRADLDVLDANPLDDIHNIRTVRNVLANGVLYNPAPLWASVGFKPAP